MYQTRFMAAGLCGLLYIFLSWQRASRKVSREPLGNKDVSARLVAPCVGGVD